MSKDKQIVITDTEYKSNNFDNKSNKQIDEMVMVLTESQHAFDRAWKECLHKNAPMPDRENVFYAKYLVEKEGYRKASDFAREIITDLENGIDGLLKVYMEERNKECATDTPLAEYISGKIDAYSSVKFRLAEFKKKYKEAGN